MLSEEHYNYTCTGCVNTLFSPCVLQFAFYLWRAQEAQGNGAALTFEVQPAKEHQAVDACWVILNAGFVRRLRFVGVADEVVVTVREPAQ